MLDFDNTSVCEECAMMCTELQYEDADEDVVVCWDQGTHTEKSTKKLHMASLLESKVTKRKKLSRMWPKAQMTVCYWKGKGGDLMKLLCH